MKKAFINTMREESNSLLVLLQPITGVISITNYSFVAEGASSVVYFRYLIDGTFYSEKKILSLVELSNLSFLSEEIVEFELIFEKQSIDVELRVTSAEIVYESEEVLSLTYYDQTLFKKYYDSNDPIVLSWCANVLGKLYNKGVIPNYINRENEEGSSEDFRAFWKSITKFFSFYVTFSRTIENYDKNKDMLRSFLSQRGLITSSFNTLEELNYFKENFYSEIVKRGTASIIEQESIYGELLRLIDFREEDEFIFNLHKAEHFGWNLRKSSPLFKSLRLNDSMNRFGNQSYEIEEESLFEGDFVKIYDIDDQRYALSVTGELRNKGAIKISSEIDYEFSFLFKKRSCTSLTVGFVAKNIEGEVIDLISRKTGLESNTFFEEIDLGREDKFVLVQGFLFNKNKDIFVEDALTINQGNNLILPEETIYIEPYIKSEEGECSVYGIRFIPQQTPFSHGLLQVSNWITCFYKNRNKTLSQAEIEMFIRRQLIPYNSYFKGITIDTSTPSKQQTEDTFSWIGGGQYCERFVWVGVEETSYCEQIED